ncbi:hypothetical protein [Streptomyces mirabilis]|uniref:hypothetical protein n=1 Tax=Streptomyces mirabilis TaxID=68239 RepID=UPI00369A9CAC
MLDHPAGSLYLSGDEHLTLYDTMFDRLVEGAPAPIGVRTSEELATKDSLALIQHLLYTL